MAPELPLRPRTVSALLVTGLLFSAAAAGGESETRWGFVALYGRTLSESSSSPGFGEVGGIGVVFERALSRLLRARLEIYPVQLYGQRDTPVARGSSGRVTVAASAACLLVRVQFARRPRWVPVVEAGAGPFYAYARPVPPGGTRGNFFDQAGLGMVLSDGHRGRWELLARYVHVSNADLGRGGRASNPGVSFAAAAIGWTRAGTGTR